MSRAIIRRCAGLGIPVMLVVLSNTAVGGTLAHWSFNNTLVEQTGNVSVNGTLESGAVISSVSAPNVGGSGALDVSAADAHFEVPSQSALDLGSDSFSFAAWIMPDGQGSGAGRIFDRRGKGDVFNQNDPGFQFVVNQTASTWNIDNTFLVEGANQFISYSTNPLFSSASGTTYSNDWHHVALVYEAGVGMTLYVDGQVDGFSGGAIGSIDDANPLSMGASILNNGSPESPDQEFSGLIDEVFLFDEILTADQINNLLETNTLTGIPEPGSGFLFATGSVCLLSRRRLRLANRWFSRKRERN